MDVISTEFCCQNTKKHAWNRDGYTQMKRQRQFRFSISDIVCNSRIEHSKSSSMFGIQRAHERALDKLFSITRFNPIATKNSQQK